MPLATNDDTGRAIRQAVDAGHLKGHLETFSTLFRDSGTEDERQAAEYLYERLQSYGLEPKILTFDSYISWPREGQLQVTLPDGTAQNVPVRTRSFGGSTTDGAIEAEMVFIPFAAPERGAMIFGHRGVAGDYESRDIAGRIVITADGGPDGIRRAQEHGALAHIHIWPSDEDAIHEMIATPVWGTPTPESAERIPRIPALGITHLDGSGLEQALESGSVKARLESNVETAWVELPLVTVDIPGTTTDKFLLVGSHIDSWYEGITDNATGDASLLEMARILGAHRDVLTHGVRFAWWPGHSTGRYSGSTWYADTFFMELRTRALGYLNIDSPGSRGSEIWDCRYNCGEVEAVTVEVIRELSSQDPSVRRPLKAGDQSFLGVGLPSLGAFRMMPVDHPDRKAVGGCGGGWWWHTPHDTLDKADVQILAEDTRAYLMITLEMCIPGIYPYRFEAVARDFSERLHHYQEAAERHLDLTDVIGRAESFHAIASDLSRTIEGLDPLHPRAASANQTMMRLSRILNPVLFTVSGPYDFDPALQLPVLPGLREASALASTDPESSDYRFLRTELVRQRNRIDDTLRTAIEVCQDFLKDDVR